MKGHTQLEKADLFLAKSVAVAMSVKHRKLSNRPALSLSVSVSGSPKKTTLTE